MLINEKRQNCKACASGNEKLAHNSDPKTCIQGADEYLRGLSNKDQLSALVVRERLSREMVSFISKLATERKKSPLDVLIEEGLRFS